MKEQYHYIFEDSLKSKIPITHHFMIKKPQSLVDEIRLNQRYSESDQHFARYYLPRRAHKPLSGAMPLNHKSEK